MSSKRGLRRAQRALRGGGAAVLNIVSLIDVFAILVFYLLVNALNPEVLPVPPALKLAESAARQTAQPTIAIAIGEREIHIDGRLVSRAPGGLAGSREATVVAVDALRAALHEAGLSSGGATARQVSIIADRRLPFRVLKQVMSVCAEEQYAHVSLAVVEKPAGGGA